MTNNIITLALTRWGAGCGGLETWYAEELGCSRNGVRVFVTIQGQAVDVHSCHHAVSASNVRIRELRRHIPDRCTCGGRCSLSRTG